MIRTNDATQAMLFMVHARRLGLDPVAMEEGSGWALETRNADFGAALWGLLLDLGECFRPQDIDALDIQAFVDDRNRFHAAQIADSEAQLESLALWHLDAAAAWRDGRTISDVIEDGYADRAPL